MLVAKHDGIRFLLTRFTGSKNHIEWACHPAPVSMHSQPFYGFLNLYNVVVFVNLYISKGVTLKFFAILNKKKFKNFKIFSEPLKNLPAGVTRLLYYLLLCRNLEKIQYFANWTPLIYRGFQQQFRFSTTGYVKP